MGPESIQATSVDTFDRAVGNLAKFKRSQDEIVEVWKNPGIRLDWAVGVATAVSEVDSCLARYATAARGFYIASLTIEASRELANSVREHGAGVLALDRQAPTPAVNPGLLEFVSCWSSINSLLAQLSICRKVLPPIDRWTAAKVQNQAVRRSLIAKLGAVPPPVRAKYRRGVTGAAISGFLAAAALIGLVVVAIPAWVGNGPYTVIEVDLVSLVILAITLTGVTSALYLYVGGSGAVDAHLDSVIQDEFRRTEYELSRP